jgi:hypothetical protein
MGTTVAAALNMAGTGMVAGPVHVPSIKLICQLGNERGREGKNTPCSMKEKGSKMTYGSLAVEHCIGMEK